MLWWVVENNDQPRRDQETRGAPGERKEKRRRKTSIGHVTTGSLRRGEALGDALGGEKHLEKHLEGGKKQRFI